jgi:hypothetical protein
MSFAIFYQTTFQNQMADREWDIFEITNIGSSLCRNSLGDDGRFGGQGVGGGLGGGLGFGGGKKHFPWLKFLIEFQHKISSVN